MLIRGMGAFQLSTLQAAAKAAGGMVTPALSAAQGVQLAVSNAGSAAAAGRLASSLLLTGAPPQPGSGAAGAALAVAQLLPISGAYDMPMTPPAPVPPPVLGGGGSPPSTGPAVPPTASVSLTIGGALPADVAASYGLPQQQGPNVTALLATLQSAGYSTSDQMVAYLQSLDGQPLNDSSMTEGQAAYYLAIIAKKRQEAKYLKWGIAGAGLVGLALLLK